ncbi:MAG: hypothetical protein H8D97_00430 [Proteobacteria bacterium]|nr:hypothetical protein [Pseudomonadota bacterium]
MFSLIYNLKGCGSEFGEHAGFIIKTTKQEIKIYISNIQSCCEHFDKISDSSTS